MKTNKSYTKRLRVTKNGKIMMRKAGQNHFNAKESRRGQMDRRRSFPFTITNKSRSRFLSNSTTKRAPKAVAKVAKA
jgi:ribosomal protein L35